MYTVYVLQHIVLVTLFFSPTFVKMLTVVCTCTCKNKEAVINYLKWGGVQIWCSIRNPCAKTCDPPPRLHDKIGIYDYIEVLKFHERK